MKMNELLLAQLEREARGTREALQRVPEGRHDWTPHPKSMPLGRLAALIARMPSWAEIIVDADELDLAKTPIPEPVQSTQQLLDIHEEALAAGRKSLANADDDRLMKNWRLRMGDKVLDDRPRHEILSDTLCHLAHHRGQLTVYLRLNDEPVPAIYGASADTAW